MRTLRARRYPQPHHPPRRLCNLSGPLFQITFFHRDGLKDLDSDLGPAPAITYHQLNRLGKVDVLRDYIKKDARVDREGTDAHSFRRSVRPNPHQSTYPHLPPQKKSLPSLAPSFSSIFFSDLRPFPCTFLQKLIRGATVPLPSPPPCAGWWFSTAKILPKLTPLLRSFVEVCVIMQIGWKPSIHELSRVNLEFFRELPY